MRALLPLVMVQAVDVPSGVGHLLNLVSSPSSAHLSFPMSLSVPRLQCPAEPKGAISGQNDNS